MRGTDKFAKLIEENERGLSHWTEVPMCEFKQINSILNRVLCLKISSQAG